MPQEISPPDCPYPGLRAFFTTEQDWYFGREIHVNDALTRLETERFLAIVGSSGSGKSSLVFAGLIPALKAGELARTLKDGSGKPAPWSIIDFKPGNAPLEELAKAISKDMVAADDKLTAGFLRASLRSGNLGLIEALKVAGHVQPQREVLIYVDQFEELFRFGEKSSVEERENAQRFSRLLVAAARQQEVRLHLLLSMRSEFIGECDRFPGLPELVSKSQFLTPRLTRKQLEQSLGLPALAVGWRVAPEALNAVLNDCGNSPDQLPLAQHVMRRMWRRSAAAGRTELTLEDYRQSGGIRDSLAKHGAEILDALPQPDGPEVARMLFMALCDQRDESPLIRRLSTVTEVESIAGKLAPLVGPVAEAFGKDDPGFLREDDGWLDVRHEAVLRQWPLITAWRLRESASQALLRSLAEAAREYANNKNDSELWAGNKLQRYLKWREEERPAAPWAIRHGVQDWEKCDTFLDAGQARESEMELEKRAVVEMVEKQRHSVRRQRMGLMLIVLLASIGTGMAILAVKAGNAEEEAVKTSHVLDRQKSDLQKVLDDIRQQFNQFIPRFILTASQNVTSAVETRTALSETLHTISSFKDISTIQRNLPKLIQDHNTSLTQAFDSLKALDDMIEMVDTASRVDVRKADEFEKNLTKMKSELARQKQQMTTVDPAPGIRLKTVINAGLGQLRESLGPWQNKPSLTPAEMADLNQSILAATAGVSNAEILLQGARAISSSDTEFTEVGDGIRDLRQTIEELRTAKIAAAPGLQVWNPDQNSGTLTHGNAKARITCIRFAPPAFAGKIQLATAGDDRSILFWDAAGNQSASWSTSSAINDIEFSPQGDALAAASNGSTVRVLRLKEGSNSKIIADAFEKHSDSITDVAYHPGGKYIASSSADRTVRIFDATTLDEVYASTKLPGIVTSVTFQPSDDILAASGNDDGMVRLHLPGLPGNWLDLKPQMGAPVRRPEFSQDGTFMVAASGDRYARLWECRQPFTRKQALEHLAPVSQATFRPGAPTGKYPLITCCANGEVRAWSDALTGGSGKGLDTQHPGAVLSAAWSADGHWLATVGGGDVLIWKWAAGQEYPTATVRITGLAEGTSLAQFSPDGKTLVTYGGHNLALLWNLGPLHN